MILPTAFARVGLESSAAVHQRGEKAVGPVLDIVL
jgi:hypothetical protein